MAQAVLPTEVMVEQVARSAASRPPRALLRTVAHHVVLIVVGVAFVLPLYWMVSTSLKSNSQLYSSLQRGSRVLSSGTSTQMRLTTFPFSRS